MLRARRRNLLTEFLYEKALDRSEAEYRRSIRNAIYGLWSGSVTLQNFVAMMVDAIDFGFSRAWLQGAAECGIGPDELSPEEQRELQAEMSNEMAYIYNLGSDIQSGSKENGGKLTPLYARADMWANRFDAIRSKARMMACEDQKLQWRMGPTKEHCGDCIRLDGKVYRASIWLKNGLEPRSRNLECHGYKCLCTLVPTDLPLTRGRPLGLM